MSEITDLKQEISETTAALSSKIGELELQAREIFSPAHQIEKHPLLCLGLSLGAGLVVGSQLSKNKKILEPIAIEVCKVLAKEFGKKYLPQNT